MPQPTPRERPTLEQVRLRCHITEGDCWEWCGARTVREGYGRIKFGQVIYRTHRLAFELVNGPIPAGLFVLHSCDNPPCCNPSHLRLGTAADNTADMDARGRRGAADRSGERNPHAKLTAEQVLYIRESVEPAKHLAVRLGMSRSRINQIRRGAGWRHVSGGAV